MRTENMKTRGLTPPYDKTITKTMTKFINRTAPLAIASVAMLLASCANDEFTGSKTTPASENTTIAFNMQGSSQIRSNDDAPTKLGNMFIVWGEKNETDGKKAEDANLVFKNYVVKYTASSANTTTSNTSGWEYVGIDHSSYNSNVSPNIGTTAQTIKYWDESASSYTFTAVSALEGDITGNKVKITKSEGSDNGTVYDKGYTIELGAGATPGSIYYADRNNITKGDNGYTHNAVTMTFRNFQSKIRFAMYETIPGYKVVVTGVKYNNTEHKSSDTETAAFGVDGKFVTVGDKTKYTVTYETNSSSNENKVKVAVDENSSTQDYCTAGSDGILKTSKESPLGTTSANPTYDAKDKGYTAILPNPSNTTDMKLTVSYELYSEDTGEKITCTDRTAVVPAAYCQWKSNYAYTYIFKISDKSAELYPITFDAAVVTDEVGNQETITTVEEPSITTFATRTTDGKTTVVTGENEYKVGDEIYASVVDATKTGTDSKAVTLSVTEGSKNIALYTVESTDATKYPITEASVANAIAHSTTSGPIKTESVTIKTTGTDDPIIVSQVPAEDGTTRNLSALKWKPTEAKTYAVEYTKNNTKTYKIVKVVAKSQD